MPSAVSFTLLLIGAVTLAGCSKESAEQNDAAAAAEVANGPVDVDTLPPDESVGTSSEELANGADEGQDADAVEQENGY
jgi:hypothetical protein